MTNNLRTNAAHTTANHETADEKGENISVGNYALPLPVFQSIYEEITEKTQSLVKFHSDPIQLGLNDIEQLNIKFDQTCRQYNVISSNSSFTIFHLDDTRETFTSYEEFLRHNAGSSSPVESILIKYNFLVISPQSRKPQAYTVSIRLVSNLISKKQMAKDFEGMPPRFIRFMSNRTVTVEIEYIEYVVARAILNMIDEWYRTIPQSPSPRYMKLLQANSHWIPRIVKFGTAVFTTFLVAKNLPHFLSANTPDLLLFGRVFSYASLAIFSAYQLAGWCGKIIEDSIDEWSPISYIKLNRGDEAEIRSHKNHGRKNVIQGLLGISGTIALETICALASDLIIRFFKN